MHDVPYPVRPSQETSVKSTKASEKQTEDCQTDSNILEFRHRTHSHIHTCASQRVGSAVVLGQGFSERIVSASPTAQHVVIMIM